MLTKNEARAEARRIRQGIPAQKWAQIGQDMSGKVFAMPQWGAADTVFCFASMPDEPDTMPILRRALAQGKRLLLPRVVPGAARQMELVAVDSLAALQKSSYGIPEPQAGQVVPAAALGAGTLAVIPCVAATAGGVRLGHGGGYYDRFLAEYTQHGGQKLLLCARALIFAQLPADEHDVRFAPEEIVCEDQAAAIK